MWAFFKWLKRLFHRKKDPEEEINDLIVKCKTEFVQVKLDTARVIQDTKTAKLRLKELDDQILDLECEAQQAITIGNESEAIRLLTEKRDLTAQRAQLQANYEQSLKLEAQSREVYNGLVRQIHDLESRRDAARMKLSAAKVRKAMEQDDGMDALKEYEAMAQHETDLADAYQDLSGSSVDKLYKKYDAMSTEELSIQEELEQLKNRQQ